MVKVIFKLLLILALLAYLVFAFVRFTEKQNEPVCDKITIEVLDSDKAEFVTEDNIRQILIKNNINPKGQKLSEINIAKIKKAVDHHQFVFNSVCYTKPNGELCIEVTQKLPMFRVMPAEGEGYYIDVKGAKIPHVQYPADVIVVTGHVDYKTIKVPITELGAIINSDEFWNDMIEQINVAPDGKWEFVPRLGNALVVLGPPRDLQKKMMRLKTFFEKVIPQVGWNKYKRVSVEYENQVVCEKTE